ncbi:MAG: phosphatase PAP2 family protein [Bacteroidales bacterium]|nr:phosphatase PAP2 family protein [Bacteroidales bacterium]
MTPFLRHMDEIDQEITLAINGMHSAFTDSLSTFFSDIKVWFPLYAIVAAFMFSRLGVKKGFIAILALGLTILACDQCANFVKDAVARLRPCYNTRMLEGGLHMLEKRGGLFGFYSGHASNAFGFAMCAIACIRCDSSQKYRGFTSATLFWATLVGLSRIMAGKHYLGDVLFGTLTGILIGAVIGFAARYIFIHREEKTGIRQEK